VPTSISVDRLQEGLRTKRFGKEIFFSHEVGSTNDWAKELALLDAPEGTVTIAETQTTGRGRLDRVWVSPVGGLYFSVILRPKLKPAETVKLVFVAGLAVAEVLRELYSVRVETKWPNDVLVNGRKVCGILSEASITDETVNFVVLGVGVNANFDVKEALPEALWKNTTSLMSEAGGKIQLEALLRAMLERFESLYDLFLKEGFTPVLEKWKRYAGFLGPKVEVLNGTEHLMGIALNVEADGSLTVKLEDGTVKRVLVGDVSLAVFH
jgi:BirA family biotin operon repressor/biotin-[acetyl-CoA-carboxylase] ligase